MFHAARVGGRVSFGRGTAAPCPYSGRCRLLICACTCECDYCGTSCPLVVDSDRARLYSGCGRMVCDCNRAGAERNDGAGAIVSLREWAMDVNARELKISAPIRVGERHSLCCAG